jgi:hypothetical protein
MVDDVAAFLKGPAFIFCLVFAILGVARLGFMHVHLIAMAFYNTWHHEYNRRDLVKVILKRAFVFERNQFGFAEGPLAWLLFDAVVVVLLLPAVGHVVLAEKFFGVRLIAVSSPLTGILLACISVSIAFRLYRLSTKTKDSPGTLNTVSFWSLLLLLVVSGYCAGTVNSPGLLRFVRLFHGMLGDICVFLIPFSRIGYWLVSPLANITSHLGVWLLPDAPKRDETSAYFKKLSEKNE